MSCVSIEDPDKFKRNTIISSVKFRILMIGRADKKSRTSSSSAITIGSGSGQFLISGCLADKIRIMRRSAGFIVSLLSMRQYRGFASTAVCVLSWVIRSISGAFHVSSQYGSRASIKPETPGHTTGTQYVGIHRPRTGAFVEVSLQRAELSMTTCILLSPRRLRAERRCSTRIIWIL